MAEKLMTDGSMALREKQYRVITIEATEKPQNAKLRVAAYARVSSASDDQLNSFAAQNRHYSDLISSKENWRMVDIYADEGITGTSAEKREDFQRLLADCRRGLIDRVLVEYIFQQYLVGATYNTLVEELREQSIPYDEGKLWNKNMIARILEDSRYTGERGYPPVIDREALEKALEKRSAKQTAAPKTDTQKLLRRFSGRPSTARMERQVLNLLNSLIVSPEQLRLPATAPPDRSTELNLQRELDRVMECQPIDEDAAKELILTIAAAQYSAVDSREYETVRLRRVFSGHQPMAALDAELLQSSVSAIHCHNDGSLNIQLKNGQVIGKE